MVQTIKENLEKEVEKIHRSDIKFYQLYKIEKIATILDKEKADCQDCKYHLKTLVKMSSNLSEQLNGQIADRRNFEKQIELIVKHLRTKHGYFPSEYYLNFYSLYGLILGIFLGWIFSQFYFLNSLIINISISSGIFVLLFRQFGRRKDKQNMQKGRVI